MPTDRRTEPQRCEVCGMFRTDDPAYASQRCVCKPGSSKSNPSGDSLVPTPPSDQREIAPVEWATIGRRWWALVIDGILLALIEGAISLARQDRYGRLPIHYPCPFSWIPAKNMPE